MMALEYQKRNFEIEWASVFLQSFLNETFFPLLSQLLLSSGFINQSKVFFLFWVLIIFSSSV